VLIGVGVLAGLLWEPQIEGRNVNATQFEIYFKDPFLASNKQEKRGQAAIFRFFKKSPRSFSHLIESQNRRPDPLGLGF